MHLSTFRSPGLGLLKSSTLLRAFAGIIAPRLKLQVGMAQVFYKLQGDVVGKEEADRPIALKTSALRVHIVFAVPLDAFSMFVLR